MDKGADSRARNWGQMSDKNPTKDNGAASVMIYNPHGQAPIALVCEHASNNFPAQYQQLGLDKAARVSHVAWDPGAAEVARGLADRLDARLIESAVSRLIYDCNRPPHAASAMPARSELFDIPGNCNLTEAEREKRVKAVYEPFYALMKATLDTPPKVRALITIHSFTPVYMGKPRSVEIGVLHDDDSRLADAMLASASAHTTLDVQRNSPYGPEDGVTHTLKEHGLKRGLVNVMLEIRNDLIATPQAARDMAQILAGWLQDALARVDIDVAATATTAPTQQRKEV